MDKILSELELMYYAYMGLGSEQEFYTNKCVQFPENTKYKIVLNRIVEQKTILAKMIADKYSIQDMLNVKNPD